MKQFRYESRDERGRLVHGELAAQSRAGALAQLQERRLFPLHVTSLASRSGRLGVQAGTQRQVIFFTRHLAHLTGAGIPLPQALGVLKHTLRGPQFQGILAGLEEAVRGGDFFWQALARYPAVFSPFYVQMVRAGEEGANLAGVLDAVCSYLEQQSELKEGFISLLAYPSAVLATGVITVFFLLSCIVPKMAFMLTETAGPLPVLTRLILNLGAWLSRWWWLVLVATGLAAGTGYRRLRQRRWQPEALMARLPVVRDVLERLLFSRFCLVFGMLLRQGIPVPEALGIVRGVLVGVSSAARLEQAQEHVTQGSSLSAALRSQQVFPESMTDMVAVGEQTGDLPQALLNIAAVYEKDTREDIRRLMALVEPALLVLVAAVVGLVVLSLLMPLFSLSFDIS